MSKMSTYQRLIQKLNLTRIGLLWVMLILFANGLSLIANAQGAVWSEPVMVSADDETYYWFPEIMADLEGKVHLYWVGNRAVKGSQHGGYDTVIHCKIENDSCLDHSEIVAYDWRGGVNVTRPSAVVDSRNTIHLLSRGIAPFGGITQIYYRQAPANLAELPNAWSDHQLISSSGSAAYSDIAIDKNDIIHVVWNESGPIKENNEEDSCLGCSNILYRRSTDNGKTWTNVLELSDSKMGAEKPQIIIGEQNIIYVVWEEGRDFYVGKGEPLGSTIIHSVDGGETWSSPTLFTFPGDAPQRITAGIDGQDKLIVVWGLVNQPEIYYQVSSDQGISWSIPKPIPGVLSKRIDVDLDTYHMASDSAGHLHLVVAGRRPTDAGEVTSVFHIEWDGTTWSVPEQIFSAQVDHPEWPRIAVVNGNELHVVWFLRDEKPNADVGLHRIWYAHGYTSAPVTKQQITQLSLEPTPDPQPLSTPVPTPTVTATLEPTLIQTPVSVEGVNSIYTEVDDVMLMMQSLLPAIMIVIVIIFGVRFWRRG
jgi:hypothetical protein